MIILYTFILSLYSILSENNRLPISLYNFNFTKILKSSQNFEIAEELTDIGTVW